MSNNDVIVQASTALPEFSTGKPIKANSALLKLRRSKLLVMQKYETDMRILRRKINGLERSLSSKEKHCDKAYQAFDDVTCEHNKKYGYCTECKNWGDAIHVGDNLGRQARRRRWHDTVDSDSDEI